MADDFIIFYWPANNKIIFPACSITQWELTSFVYNSKVSQEAIWGEKISSDFRSYKSGKFWNQLKKSTTKWKISEFQTTDKTSHF